MKTKLLYSATVILSLLASLLPARAEWPARLFAPYMYIGSGDSFKLTDCDDACGVKYYTLAFIIADHSNNPAWDGRTPMEQNLYADQIAAIRQRGGDVIMSFGGQGGRDISLVETNLTTLVTKYQSVIDRYHFTWLDFDIEGDNLLNAAANERRNSALAELQKKNPGLRLSYTLPVFPDGIMKESIHLLADAKAKGVSVYSVDIMVMYFGNKYVGKGKSEAELGIESSNSTIEQLQKIDPAIKVGLCACLGRNGSANEVFTLDDARVLRAYADKTPAVCSLHFWSINKDAARPGRRGKAGANAGTNNVPGTAPQPWAFANLFKSFTASAGR